MRTTSIRVLCRVELAELLRRAAKAANMSRVAYIRAVLAGHLGRDDLHGPERSRWDRNEPRLAHHFAKLRQAALPGVK